MTILKQTLSLDRREVPSKPALITPPIQQSYSTRRSCYM